MVKHVQWNNGNGLYEVRSAAGDSQRTAGEKCGIAYTTIERLENGKNNVPHSETINAIQEAYNVVFDGIEYHRKAESHRKRGRE